VFLGTYDIDEYVVIPAVTHRFSSGAAYAPTAISYSIYEEGSTTGLDENVDMTPASPFDSVVGFYYARRQLTAAAGFERGKTYVVLVKATVDAVAAIEAHVFQVRQHPAFSGTDIKADITRPTGSVVSDESNTSSTFKTDLSSSTTDYCKRAILKFTSGNLDGQISKITGYNGSTKFVTVQDAFTEEPTASDTFDIINE